MSLKTFKLKSFHGLLNFFPKNPGNTVASKKEKENGNLITYSYYLE